MFWNCKITISSFDEAILDFDRLDIGALLVGSFSSYQLLPAFQWLRASLFLSSRVDLCSKLAVYVMRMILTYDIGGARK